MKKRGSPIIAILIVISFITVISFVIYNYYTKQKKLMQGIQDISKITMNDFLEVHPKGDFPEEMKDFLSTSTVDLFDYCLSHPNDFRNQSKLSRHYKGVVLYKNADLSKYKKILLPKIKNMLGKYTMPDCFKSNDNSDKNKNLSYSPDLKVYQNTLIEWCLIANRFEEKNEINSAFLLSYAAIRMGIKLLTDYADSASEENLRVANNILRCASCQLIYIANSGLKHNSNNVRAIAKDLYSISEQYSPLSRTVNYNLNLFDNMIKKYRQINSSISHIDGNSEESKISIEFKAFFKPLFDVCDLPYYKSNIEIDTWHNSLKSMANDAVNKLETDNLPKLIAYSFVNRNELSDYKKLRYNMDETRVILDGAATVLATYEFFDKSKYKFKYSPKIIAEYVNSSFPSNKLFNNTISIDLSTSSSTQGVIYCKNLLDEKLNFIFLTHDELVLRFKKQENKALYFDIDEAISNMTPKEKARYEKSLAENEKQEAEARKKAEEILKKYKTDSVEIDSLYDFLKKYKLGKVAENVNDSYYRNSKYMGKYFMITLKKAFGGEFKSAYVNVDDTKKINSVSLSKCYDTTSERETAFLRVQTDIEAMDGIEIIKNSDNNKEKKIVYSIKNTKDNITLNLLKGLDGGGTLSMIIVPLK